MELYILLLYYISTGFIIKHALKYHLSVLNISMQLIPMKHLIHVMVVLADTIFKD